MAAIERLLEIMQTLRDPQNGCPWDREQTFRTIVPHTLEEAYEVAETIERNDLAALRDELGDLLFQVVFYAQLAREQGLFDFEDVVAAINDKLQRRHPHVFGDVEINDAEEQTRHWEQLKAEERQAQSGETHSILDGIAHTLPAMDVAAKLQKRAARVGFDWPDYHGPVDKVKEELNELQVDWADAQKREEEMGDLLFTCVNLARHAGIDPEQALRGANRKFETRFRDMEQQLKAQGLEMDTTGAEALERAWEASKSNG
jgi:MazG family protein